MASVETQRWSFEDVCEELFHPDTWILYVWMSFFGVKPKLGTNYTGNYTNLSGGSSNKLGVTFSKGAVRFKTLSSRVWNAHWQKLWVFWCFFFLDLFELDAKLL